MKEQILLPDQTLSHKLLSKGFWLYLFAFLTLPLGYIIRVILSNDLSVGEVGIIYSLISFMGLLSILSTLGISQLAMVYFIPKYIISKQKDYVSTIYKIVRYINIGMTVFLAVLLYFLIGNYGVNYIDNPQATSILYIFLGFFIFLNLQKPIEGVYKTVQNVFIPEFSNFIKQAIISLIVIGLFITGIGNITNYSLAFLIGGIISYLIYFIVFKYKYSFEFQGGKFVKDSKLFKTILIFGLSVLIADNSMIIINNIDMQMLLLISGAASAGYYTNYMSLIAIVMFFLSPILGLLFPMISEINSKDQIEKLRLLQNFLYKYVLIFAFSIVVLLLVFGEVLSVILFGENFLYSGTLLQYLAIFGIFKVLFTINLSILMGIGQAKKRTHILLGVMILNIILNILLIPLMGALGAGIATGISWVIIALFSFNYVYKNLKIDFDIWFYMKNTLIISIIGMIYYLLIPEIFELENVYRYSNLVYLLIMGFGAYIIWGLFNLKELKIFRKELKMFKNS